MTEKLKTLMNDAADIDFVTPDLDVIVRNGDKAVRRRRLAVGAAGAAAAAVVTTGAVIAAGGMWAGDDHVADDPIRNDVPMWTMGSTLHTPDATYDLGQDVVSLARTSAGIAYAAEDLGVYAFAGDGPERIGSVEAANPVVVGDSDGTLVGWVDRSGAEPEFAVHDLATGETTRYDADTVGTDEYVAGTAFFFAIDGPTAYWLDGRGTVATDIGTGADRILGSPEDPSYVIAVEDGITVTLVEGPGGEDLGVQVVDDTGEVLLPPSGSRFEMAPGSRALADGIGALSPDGRWAASLGSTSVWDVRAGRELPLDLAAQDAAGYDWLDADTLMVLADSESDTIDLFRCDVPAGTCTEVGEIATEGKPFALPNFGLLSGVGSSEVSSEEAEVVESEGDSPAAPPR